MAIIKCKMCGGDLILVEGQTVAECAYCGSRQTVPTADSEKKLTLFSRANRLLRGCEFDKASGVYESIVAEFPEEAEAYWGLVLCRYGIEYVDDPATGKKIPTCHRSSFESVLEDGDYEQALENADTVARKVYREEAKAIEELREGILEVSGKEEPYDIFICYKETDENGDRTMDSVLAQDIYDALTERGYRVFFSRITLEDKLGQEYEPYIFAALNSARIMLAVGTDYEYYNAVWVKNEWSRFLKLMAAGQKKTLIPCYKGIDAYDMPKEFAKLQAQDLGKVGAMQDLLRGIEKILPRHTAAPAAPSAPEVEPLLRRGHLFLEDGDWNSADECFNKALDIDPENADAYIGKLLVTREAHNQEELINAAPPIEDEPNYKMIARFDSAKANQLTKAIQARVAELKEEWARLAPSFKEWQPVMNGMISAGDDYTVGVKADGTAVATKYMGDKKYYSGQCDVSGWRDIVAISAGGWHTIGLKADGAAVATKYGYDFFPYSGQCDVSDWKDIVAVAGGTCHSVGLKADGTVVATKYKEGKYTHYDGQCDVSGWRDVTAIAASGDRTVGLKADGTVVATKYTGDSKHYYGQCDVSDWTDIVAIAAGGYHTVGLKADGTVVAVGRNDDGECDVSGWTDVIAISAGSFHTVGLKADGTVVAAGQRKNGQCGVSGWTDIIAISAGSYHTVGLKADGTVVATEFDGYQEDNGGQCNVSGWKLFNDLEAVVQKRQEVKAQADQRIEEAREQAKRARQEAEERARQEAARRRQEEAERKRREAERLAAERQRRREALEREKAALSAELSTLKGLFSGKRRREVESRIAAIDSELRTLS